MAGIGSLPGYQGLQGHVEDKMDILGRGKSGELPGVGVALGYIC